MNGSCAALNLVNARSDTAEWQQKKMQKKMFPIPMEKRRLFWVINGRGDKTTP